jgi:hypothetical protein
MKNMIEYYLDRLTIHYKCIIDNLSPIQQELFYYISYIILIF